MGTKRSRVLGTGSYLPPRVVTNAELTRYVDTSDEWIVQRTGIRERRWVDGETTTSDLALAAARRAIASSGVAAGEIDMIILATLSPDHDFPGTACFLQAKLDLPGIPAIDVRQQCTGFLYALAIADQFIRTGARRNVLVVGAEVHSKGLEFSTRGRDVAVLFGDGAGAVVVGAVEVEAPDRESCILSTHLHADGHHARELWTQAPSQAYPHARITPEVLERGEQYPRMNGRAVFVHAVRRMSEAVCEALGANAMGIEDIDLLVLHQANLRISEAVTENLGVPPAKVFSTIERYANTTAATIPIGLDEAVAQGDLRPGMLVAAAAFGSGFTWASALIRW